MGERSLFVCVCVHIYIVIGYKELISIRNYNNKCRDYCHKMCRETHTLTHTHTYTRTHTPTHTHTDTHTDTDCAKMVAVSAALQYACRINVRQLYMGLHDT